MRVVKAVEMASSSDIYEVSFGALIEIKENDGSVDPDFYKDVKFIIFENGEGSDCADTKREANEIASSLMIDEDLVITGYGTHSGRKFWQLPEKLQGQVRKMARKAL